MKQEGLVKFDFIGATASTTPVFISFGSSCFQNGAVSTSAVLTVVP